MKCPERLLLRRTSTETSQFQDPHQFAYRRNRSTEDAILTLVHHAQKHLDTPKTSARILFLDFSSAFNTIQPHILLQKLRAMLVNPSLRKWIWDFLTNRKQWVKINNTISSTITTNSGAPQGCVSSPALFSVYTSDCRPVDSSISKDHLFKYADDKVLLGLITENNHQIYMRQKFKTWFHGVIRTVYNLTPRKLTKWSLTSANQLRIVLLDRVVRSASTTIGSTLPTVDELYETYMIKKQGTSYRHFSPIARILLCCTVWL